MAIITAAEARLFIPTLTGTGSDSDLEALIAKVDASMAEWCGYPRRGAALDPTFEDQTYTLYSGGFSGAIEVSEDGQNLTLPVRPIVSVTSVHDDPDQGYGSAYAVDSDDYSTSPVDGVIRLKPTGTHGAFSRVPFAVKVVAVLGFATIPEAIKQAAVLTVRHWWDQKKEGLKSNVSANGVSIAPQVRAIPREAMELLAPYRIPAAWVA